MAEAQRRIDRWVADGDVEESLIFTFLNLTTLPKLPDNLKVLYCGFNKLKTLPALPNSLEELYCFKNKLTNLPALPNTLRVLKCDYNELVTLPKLPNSLVELHCNHNKLFTLPKLPDSLTLLHCRYNKLIKLPTFPDSLTDVHIGANELLPKAFNIIEYPNEDRYEDDNVFTNRIRKLQKSKTTVTNTIKSHATKKKRNVFANTTYKDLPRNVVKQIANYMDEEDLENININSLKPKKVKRGETRKLKKV